VFWAVKCPFRLRIADAVKPPFDSFDEAFYKGRFRSLLPFVPVVSFGICPVLLTRYLSGQAALDLALDLSVRAVVVGRWAKWESRGLGEISKAL
jgi:hypothetical protein